MVLREFAKKLSKNYGWSSADFLMTSSEPEGAEALAVMLSPKSPASNLAIPMSSVSFLPVEQNAAQSARTYFSEDHLLEAKVKVKSRSDTLAIAPENEKKRGFMSKFGFRAAEETMPGELQRPRNTWFSRLTKKSTASMHQLLRTSEDEIKGMASMKWETFLKLMREMGFTYDPTTPGHSFRFEPPDPKDVSITFCKPHPDPTIHPVMLREFAKKLKKNYGWSEADFLMTSSKAEAPAITPAPKSPASNLATPMSSVSLLPVDQNTVQSARTYSREDHFLEAKIEVKSRSEVSLAVTPGNEKKRGFMPKFGYSAAEETKPEELQRPRNTWFSRLTKKSTASMYQLLRTSEDETKGMASMKWETFLKLMREMGFTYDPSTLGSSVRFEPPDPKDVSITFHKPHPDPTIHPAMLREFAKKLKKSYGWSEADFVQTSNHDATRGMHWNTFVKRMQDKGFEYDLSVGSSARFDPPDQNDMSITFYKPHLDAAIHPIVLEEFAKKLERNYTWMNTDFLRV
ncbi:hypothetical protein B0H19DRAFT_53007 [Mycena capillaripes]|nr:hypothetical protein B0H19DRAFT_53007 [Mycena capillaripes]